MAEAIGHLLHVFGVPGEDGVRAYTVHNTDTARDLKAAGPEPGTIESMAVRAYDGFNVEFNHCHACGLEICVAQCNALPVPPKPGAEPQYCYQVAVKLREVKPPEETALWGDRGHHICSYSKQSKGSWEDATHAALSGLFKRSREGSLQPDRGREAFTERLELLHGLLRPRPQDLEEADLLLAFAACAALQPGAGGAAEA